MNKRMMAGKAAVVISLSLAGCAKISSTVTLQSSDLSSSLLGMQADFEEFAVNNCTPPASSSYVKCSTPINLTGEVWYTGLMVGAGSTGYSVGPLVGEVENPGSNTDYRGNPFDAAAAQAATGKLSCCGGSPYPADSDAKIQYFQMYPVFIDAKFSIDSGAMSGTHTFRVYFSPVDSYQKGDVLYKDSAGRLYWCTAGSGCTATTRPASPVQYTAIKDFSNSGQGHPSIPALFIKPASTQASTTLTSSTMSRAKSFSANVSLQLSQFVAWSSDPSAATRLDQLAQYFRFNVSDAFTSTATGMTATWTVSAQ
jgi:hypothetical protein